MKKTNVLSEKSYSFALKVVKLCLIIQKNQKEYVLTRQLLRSATSVGANAEEAIGGSSDKDFVHKLSISYREARETKYWIRLLKDAELIEEKIGDELLVDIEEILKLSGASIRTMRGRMGDK